MLQKKILITGGTGYIGNYITKMLAYQRPEVLILSLSRKSPDKARKVDEQTAKFSNVKFVQANILKPETYPAELNECSAVIHTVGILIQGLNYQQLLRTGLAEGVSHITSGARPNPASILRSSAKIFGQLNEKPEYEQSYEAMNRDSCKLIAEAFNKQQAVLGKKGNFVFLSAEQHIAPGFSKYYEMKREAEEYLLNSCPNINPIILRPGLVWHPTERRWSFPLAVANDLGFQINKNILKNIPGLKDAAAQQFLPQSGSINLSVLADYAIKGALGHLNDAINDSKIWNNETMKSL